MGTHMVIAELRLGLVDISWTFVFQIINTFILFLILKHFLFKPVTEFMEKREREIKQQFQDAKNMENQAMALKESYEQKLAQAEGEGKAIIKQYTLRAEGKASDIVKTAEGEVEDMKQKAERELERERVKTVNTLKNQLSELTVLAASKVVAKEMDASDHKQLIDACIQEVGDAQWQN